MEPKPKPHPQLLDWVIKAREGYKSPAGPFVSETTIKRATHTIEAIDRHILPHNQNPSILVVGIGTDEGSINCSYVPFQVAAHLDQRAQDYSISFLDIDKDVVSDIEGREHIFLHNHTYNNPNLPSFKNAWDQYLAETDQSDAVVTTAHEGLIFQDHVTHSKWPGINPTVFLDAGFRMAGIPANFKRKIKEEKIKLIQGDIALVDLEVEEFDFIDCRNVLYQMSTQEGQMLAIANMVSHLKQGGILVVNDLGYTGNPFSAKFGGWLDDDKMRELGLIILESEGRKNSATVYF